MDHDNETPPESGDDIRPFFAAAKRVAWPASLDLVRNAMSYGLGISPAIKLAETAKLAAGHTPLIAKAIENIQKGWQIPLGIKAFAPGLDIVNRMPKLPGLGLEKLGQPFIKSMGIDWNSLMSRDERALRFAAQNNWFIQAESSYTLTREIDECGEDTDKLDQLMAEDIRMWKESVLTRLRDAYPERAPIIEETFRLHDEGRYLASIPLAMLSAEGIAYDVSETSIFNIDRNKPAISHWLHKQELSDFAKAFLASLTEKYPMSTPRNGKLSRHRVLHGYDTKYGSELFSLQAISLLGFVGWAFAPDGLVGDS